MKRAWGTSRATARFCLCNCGVRLDLRHDCDRKFASNKCQAEYEYRQYIAEWKAGKQSGLKGSLGHLSGHIRRYILERDNYQCVICGWGQVNPHTGTWPLVVDHIDGDASEVGTVESNLRTLCPNCDSLTSTYKGANRGKGRENRRALYRLGVSHARNNAITRETGPDELDSV